MNREAPKYVPRVKRIAGILGVPSRSDLGEGHVGIAEMMKRRRGARPVRFRAKRRIFLPGIKW